MSTIDIDYKSSFLRNFSINPFILNSYQFCNQILFHEKENDFALALFSYLSLRAVSAIAYNVTSEDVIPKNIYGSYGYTDDNYISSYVLKMVADVHGYEFSRHTRRFK